MTSWDWGVNGQSQADEYDTFYQQGFGWVGDPQERQQALK